MDPQLWKQVDALLEEALDQPPEKRETFVAEACKGNPVLRDEVLSLLNAQSRAGEFMEGSAMSVAVGALAQKLTTTASLAGKELGPYKVEKLLGAGGMGEVYLARDTKLDRMVALKILPWHFLADADRLARFKREARALSSLNHPNLITIYEVGEAKSVHFIAMEFVEGQTLSALRSKLTVKELLSIVAQAAGALAAAHQSGVVHRDIKPDNVMVRPDGYVKVLDFGLVKLMEVSSDPKDVANTELGVAMGTLSYMSPEQAAGEPIDHRTDIWSLGVVLYELVTGQRPFAGQSRQATINGILSIEPAAPSVLNPSLPAELDQVLNKALEKDRELRYQTASDFRADIRRVLRVIDSSPSSSRSRVRPRPVVPFALRRLWPVAAAVLIAAVSWLVWYYFFNPRTVAPNWTTAAQVQLTTQPGTESSRYSRPTARTSFTRAMKTATTSTVGDAFWITRGDRQIARPELSPDGTRFVMRVPRRTQDDIAVVNRDGTNWRDLTNDKFFDRYPRWSPDGKRIVFTSDRSGRYEIWTLEADATNLRQLTFDSPGDTTFPLWSPDGSQILLHSNFVNKIFNVNEDWNKQTPQLLPTPDGGARFVAWDWSPDGKKLIGTLSLPRLEMAYFSLETNRYERLLESAGSPMCLPDSTRFLFFTDNKAYLSDINSKNAREIFSSGDGDLRSIDITPDGTLLYFTVHTSESDIWLLDLQ